MSQLATPPLPPPLPEGTPTPANYLFAACQRCGISIHDNQADYSVAMYNAMLCDGCERLVAEGEVAMGGVL